MAQKTPAKRRGLPWSKLAKEMIAIGKEAADADSTAWLMWFEYRCPQTYALISENEAAVKELYEQSSGVSVEEEEDDEEEETKE